MLEAAKRVFEGLEDSHAQPPLDDTEAAHVHRRLESTGLNHVRGNSGFETQCCLPSYACSACEVAVILLLLLLLVQSH